MDFDGLNRQLHDNLADLKLSNEERDELRRLGNELVPGRIRFLRNRAFGLVRELVPVEEQGEQIVTLKWLEQAVCTLEVTAAASRSRASAYFSPGEECRRKTRELCWQARRNLDICVFTISDDQPSAEVLVYHWCGVPVQIINDDGKQFDEGGDIHALREAGVSLRIDDNPFRMHHKFALVDGVWLFNGSFNRTRSASVSNGEDLPVTDDAVLIGAYRREFEELWGRHALCWAAAARKRRGRQSASGPHAGRFQVGFAPLRFPRWYSYDPTIHAL